jgi:hypothetical protein
MTILKMTLALGGRHSIAGCVLLACLNFAYADLSNNVIAGNGVDRATQGTHSMDHRARGGPLHLFPSEYHGDGSVGTACDANKRTAKSHCVPVPKRSRGENQ